MSNDVPLVTHFIFSSHQKENCRPDGRELSEFRTTTLNIGETQYWPALYIHHPALLCKSTMRSSSLVQGPYPQQTARPWWRLETQRSSVGSKRYVIVNTAGKSLDHGLKKYSPISCVCSRAGADKPHSGGPWERLHRWVHYEGLKCRFEAKYTRRICTFPTPFPSVLVIM